MDFLDVFGSEKLGYVTTNYFYSYFASNNLIILIQKYFSIEKNKE